MARERRVRGSTNGPTLYLNHIGRSISRTTCRDPWDVLWKWINPSRPAGEACRAREAGDGLGRGVAQPLSNRNHSGKLLDRLGVVVNHTLKLDRQKCGAVVQSGLAVSLV